jgi:3-deoxy-D-manno-octulosonic-acid transferase
VGELLAARPLLKALQERFPRHDVVLTYTTKTAAEIARREFKGLYHVYAPVDLSWVVERFFDVLNPALVVLIELELWPNWLMTARSRGVPVLVANGRISERSARGYQRFGPLLAPAFAGVTRWAMQDATYALRAARLAALTPELRRHFWLEHEGRWWVSAQELSLAARMALEGRVDELVAAAERGEQPPLLQTSDPERRALGKPHRALELGSPPRLFGVEMLTAPVVVAGNIKYDALREAVPQDAVDEFRRLFSITQGQRVIVLGSTHPGEHEAIAPMLARLVDDATRAIVVPRHPERVAACVSLLEQAGLGVRRRSALGGPVVSGPRDVIVLDTVGELSRVYALADVVFVGGSLIPHGGQNMAEPVALGKPTLFGPHTENFKATVRELLEIGGARRVESFVALEAGIREVLAGPEAARVMALAGRARLLAGRGSLARHLEIIEEMLGAGQSDSRSMNAS